MGEVPQPSAASAVGNSADAFDSRAAAGRVRLQQSVRATVQGDGFVGWNSLFMSGSQLAFHVSLHAREPYAPWRGWLNIATKQALAYDRLRRHFASSSFEEVAIPAVPQ